MEVTTPSLASIGVAMKYLFGTIVRPSEEDGGYWAEVPDLPGCFGAGDTFAACVASVSNGVETHIAAMIEDGKSIPETSRITAEDGDVVYVYADLATVELTEPSVTASEAARKLGVTPGRISQLLKAGKLEGRRMTNTTLVTIASLERYASSPRKAGRPQRETAMA